MRPTWSGALAVGLVNIPISVVSAYSHRGVDFHLMHKKCKTRIGYGRHCPACKAEIDWKDVVRAYEYKKDKYVIVSEDDIKKVDPRLAKMIEIREFVPSAALDPIFVQNVSYLIPGPNAAKAYFLLIDLLDRTDKIALAKMVMKEKELWVAVRSTGRVLQLVSLHYHEEINPIEMLGLPKKPVLSRGDIGLGEKLIEGLSHAFEPGRYTDEFEKKLKRVVAKKVKGEKIVVQKEAPQKFENLTRALQKSLKKKK